MPLLLLLLLVVMETAMVATVSRVQVATAVGRHGTVKNANEVRGSQTSKFGTY
jgi:hypothetical protein